MQEKLNKDVSEFFLLPIEKITYERIKKVFDKKDTNEYGNLLHAAVQNKFDEEKVLKFIEILLKNGYDVNYSSKNTGYNFIQLALYGYTDEKLEKDFSYSQDFIVKLIKIAKKYGLDVNARDNDGDSIVHTAIASEVYVGSILPILDALGDDFDINCQDNNGNSLNKAFYLYKKEAEKTNKRWFNRLEKEESKLMIRLEFKSLPLKNMTKSKESKKEISRLGVTRKRTEKTELDKIIEQEGVIIKKLEKIVNNINVEYLIQNKDNIFSLKRKLHIILTKKSSLLNLENEFENIWKKFDELFKHNFSMEIDKLRRQNNMEQLTKLISVLEEYNYTEELELINKIISEYTQKEKLNNKEKKELTLSNEQDLIDELSKSYGIDKEVIFNLLNQVGALKKTKAQVEKKNDSELTTVELIEQIKKELTLANKQDFINKIQKLNNIDKEELLNLFKQQEDKLLSLVMEIKEQVEFFKKMDVPIAKDNYSKLTIAKLEEILKQNERIIQIKKKDILEEKQMKLEACINEILALETIGVFGNDELWNVIKDSTLKKNKVKKK